MKLVVGLGNPGEAFQQNRHNIGFMYLDFISLKRGVEFKYDKKYNADIAQYTHTNHDYFLVKPQTFMNDSGESAGKIARFYKIPSESTWIVHDDLDIKFGEYKIQLGRGPKGHNGIISISNHLNTEQFWRVRVGVDARNADYKQTGEEYVLANFMLTEKNTLENIFTQIQSDLEM